MELLFGVQHYLSKAFELRVVVRTNKSESLDDDDDVGKKLAR